MGELCRACKKRPAHARKKIDEPGLAAAMAEIRRRRAGLCCECSVTASMAAVDQACERIERGESS